MSSKFEWVKDLAHSENQLEETGLFDQRSPLDPTRLLIETTLQLLNQLKTGFIEASTAFNQWKTSPSGRIKVYGIAKTHCDFMLFRNGLKMVFSMKDPGVISIRYNFIVSNPLVTPDIAHNTASVEEHQICARLSPFGDVSWSFQDSSVTIESIIRYHMTLFVKESSH
jgi:hypothetical protein